MYTQKGFSLIEVLITLIIVSVSVIGFAETELRVLKNIIIIHNYYEKI